MFGISTPKDVTGKMKIKEAPPPNTCGPNHYSRCEVRLKSMLCVAPHHSCSEEDSSSSGKQVFRARKAELIPFPLPAAHPPTSFPSRRPLLPTQPAAHLPLCPVCLSTMPSLSISLNSACASPVHGITLPLISRLIPLLACIFAPVWNPLLSNF